MSEKEFCSWCGSKKDLWFEEAIIPWYKAVNLKSGDIIPNKLRKRYKTGRLMCHKCMIVYTNP